MSEPGFFETLDNTRAIKRLKPDPVPFELIRKVLDAGTKAPKVSVLHPTAGRVEADALAIVTEPDGAPAAAARSPSPWRGRRSPPPRSRAVLGAPAGDARRARFRCRPTSPRRSRR